MGESKNAARNGIGYVCISRVLMAVPGMSAYIQFIYSITIDKRVEMIITTHFSSDAVRVSAHNKLNVLSHEFFYWN